MTLKNGNRSTRDLLSIAVEPHRRAILKLVSRGEMSAGEIAARFKVTGPAISQHLRALLDAGLLEERREGTFRFYRVRPEGARRLVIEIEKMTTNMRRATHGPGRKRASG